MRQYALAWARAVAVGLLAAFACAVAASPSQALTVSPAGTWSAAGALSFRTNSTAQTITCSSASFNTSMSSGGFGSVAAGGWSSTTCTHSLASFTVTQPLAWSTSIALAPGPKVMMTVAIPSGGLRFTGVFMGSPCTFTMGSGTFVFGRTFGSLPISMFAPDTLNLPSATLYVDSASCSSYVTVPGLAITVTGDISPNGVIGVS